YTWYTNFVVGWLGLYQSPELMQFAQHLYLWRDGMWKYRWGDQQFFPFAAGAFDNGTNIADFTWLRK
ncbi:unnamed protein product, partial [Phaeothamnion confervicola]